ncbi:MAG: helix-turn-helix domain-containing protein [Turicibacter sp.]|nr:helix-turn-helix domain-containing protein [Turicibacter sp.]
MSFAKILKALANPVRRDILALLKQGPLFTWEIADNFHMTKATISYHLYI